jgi:hypothetical protein
LSGHPFRLLSRRGFSALLLNGAAVWASCASAMALNEAGRRLGGNDMDAADPAETLGQDRGIGGTGVIGTIRGFGSIVVNDLRVSFPAGVRVAIDGAPAISHDLRLGQVVHVLARKRRGLLATRAIVVRSEVVGPIDVAGPRSLVVLGQHVDLDDGLPALDHQRGDIVAVSGLRRPDGTLVASLVETRPPGPSRLRGPLATGSDGSFTIGRLRIAGLAPSLAGRRVSLVGRRVEDRFHATTVYIEPHVPFAAADRLLLEDYVARTPDGIRFGSGLDMVGNAAAALRAAMPMGESVRAVVTAKAGPEGRLGVESLRVARDGRGPGSHGGHRDPGLHGAGRPGATGDGVDGSAARGAGRASSRAGPGGPRGGGPAGARR